MPEYTTEGIERLGDKAFRELVTEHLHPETGDPEMWEALLARPLIKRTRALLAEMRNQVEATLRKRERESTEYQLECLNNRASGRTDWVAHKAEYQDWRKKAVGFKRLVERRQVQAKAAAFSRGQEQHNREQEAGARRSAAHVERMTEQRQLYLEIIRLLSIGIQQHQAMTAVAGRSPEQHDYDLWRALDNITIPMGPDEIYTALRKVLETFWFQTTAATANAGVRRQMERLMRQAPAGRSPSYEGAPKARHVGSTNPLA